MNEAVRNIMQGALAGARDFRSEEPVEARLLLLAHEILTENFDADPVLLAALLTEAANKIVELNLKRDKFFK